MTTIYDFNATDIRGNVINFSAFKDKVLLIINTASKCGFTPQLTGLQALHDKYHEKGLVVIGFPCNQFGGQEPHNEHGIQEFCQINYGVSFLMMSKVEVNGDNAHPVFNFLKGEQGGFLTDNIKWNFTKFLINKHGEVVNRYAPTTKPESLAGEIEKLLGV